MKKHAYCRGVVLVKKVYTNLMRGEYYNCFHLQILSNCFLVCSYWLIVFATFIQSFRMADSRDSHLSLLPELGHLDSFHRPLSRLRRRLKVSCLSLLRDKLPPSLPIPCIDPYGSLYREGHNLCANHSDFSLSVAQHDSTAPTTLHLE